MDRGGRDHHREHKEHSYKDTPTLSFQMKTWKFMHKQLRAISKFTKDSTTVTFTGTPSILIQTAKNNLVLKVNIGPDCLYVTDSDRFMSKTINNSMAVFESFMHILANPEITKLYVQNDNDLYTRVLVNASDIYTQASIPCVNGQEIVKDHGKYISRIDMEYGTVNDIIKWLIPTTKSRRNAKLENHMTHILIQNHPPTIKFFMEDNEIEFNHNNRVVFHEVKNTKLTVSSKNLFQAFAFAAVLKTNCIFRVTASKDMKIYISSKNNLLVLESYISQEQNKDDIKFDRKTEEFKNDKTAKDDCDRSEKHKITNYMSSGKSGTSTNNFFDDSELESDDDSIDFERPSSSKRQKCSM